jgi:hypothetical protein
MSDLAFSYNFVESKSSASPSCTHRHGASATLVRQARLRQAAAVAKSAFPPGLFHQDAAHRRGGEELAAIVERAPAVADQPVVG